MRHRNDFKTQVMKPDTNSSHQPERQRILDYALNARSLPEIEQATQALRKWVCCHPDDVGIQEAFEGLSLLRDIAEEQEAEHATVLEPTASS